VRTIDWNVTARCGAPFVKLFREERERPVWLVTDLHAGLFFGSQRQLKSALLLRAAAFRFWLSRLWDLHLPRDAALLQAKDPTHFERVLRERIERPWHPLH